MNSNWDWNEKKPSISREFLFHKKWKKFKNLKKLRIKKNQGLINRKTTRWQDSTTEEYFVGTQLHRVDGPARIHYKKNGEIYLREWMIHDVQLIYFDSYITLEPKEEKLFEYVNRYPKLTKQVSFLAIRNKWLTEDQITILSTVAAFSKE